MSQLAGLSCTLVSGFASVVTNSLMIDGDELSSRSINGECSSSSITKNILSIFLVGIVLSNNYDSPHNHKHPNARWSRKFAKDGFTSLQMMGESSSSITGQVIKENMFCDVL
jgi:hypothetical protein